MEKSAPVPYRLRFKIGDKVVLPSGTPGIIKDFDILMGGHVLEVKVRPITNWWHHLWLAVAGKLRFYDDQIDKLELAASEEWGNIP